MWPQFDTPETIAQDTFLAAMGNFVVSFPGHAKSLVKTLEELRAKDLNY